MSFSMMELMIVVTSVAVTSAGLAAAGKTSPAMSVVVALCLGPTVAGPPLLWWRRRQGTLTGKWGAGEKGWCGLGIYLLALLVANIIWPSDARTAVNWLIVASAFSFAILALVLVRRGLRALFRQSSPNEPAGGASPARWTNTFGLAMLALYASGGLLAIVILIVRDQL